jgi:hypothetical protein
MRDEAKSRGTTITSIRKSMNSTLKLQCSKVRVDRPKGGISREKKDHMQIRAEAKATAAGNSWKQQATEARNNTHR